MSGVMVKEMILYGGRMISKEQCRAARGWLDFSQGDLAERAKVNRKTIADFERGVSVPHDRTLRDIQATLENSGIEFVFDGVLPVGIRRRSGTVSQD
jgi:DNA-binding XRE family transcriptional regulator